MRFDNQRLEILATASSVLASSLDYAETLGNITRLVVPDLADWCVVYALHESNKIERLAMAHRNPAKREIQRQLEQGYPMDFNASNPVSLALRTGRPVLLPEMSDDVQRKAARDPEHLQLLRGMQFRSGIAVPLTARGRVLGCLAMAISESGRRYDTDDLALAEEMGLRCAFAVDNAVLFREARRAEDSMRFLAEASAILNSSLDYQTTLSSISRLAVPEFADVCVVYLIEADGTIRRAAAAHVDPEKEEVLRRLNAIHPIRADRNFGIARVLVTGEALLQPSMDEEGMLANGWTRESIRLLRDLGFRSSIVAPMIARERKLGGLSLARDKNDAYGPRDLTIARDLAQRCAFAVDNARLFSEIQAADRHKSEFLAMLAHELRNPLAAVTSALQVIQSPAVSETLRERAAETALRQVRHQARMVDDLLDVSRLGRQRIALHSILLNVSELVGRCVEDLQDAIARSGIVVKLHCPGAPLLAMADPTRLTQAVTNLITNALRFSSPGGTVRIAVEEVETSVRISVQDQGKGIAPEILPRLFEPFFQGQQPTDRPHGGLGLGLSLVKGIMELHGGRVTAASAGEGKGATFTLTLPLAGALPR